jgi:hypothetical protein
MIIITRYRCEGCRETHESDYYITKCAKCGEEVCEFCYTEIHGKPYCDDCFPDEEEEIILTDKRRILYD